MLIEDLRGILRDLAIGVPVTVTLLRGHSRLEVSVVPIEAG